MCYLLNIIPTKPKCFSLNQKQSRRSVDTVEPTRGQLRHYSNGLSQPRPSPPLLPDSNILQHSKLLDLYSVLQCGPFEVRTRTPESPLDWTQTRETLSVTEAVPRPSLGVLEGLSRSNRGYSCPEPMWVTNRRGREGTLAATLSRSELLPDPNTNWTEVSHDTPKGS